MRAPARLALLLLLAAVAACETQSGVTQASVTVTQPPGRDDGEVTSADLAAVPGDLASNPVRLNGLSQRGVRAALGPPAFRRRDKFGSLIWQYYGEGCVLHLFIYDEDGQQRVSHHEVRAPNGEPVGRCFRGIVDNRRRPQPS